MNQINIKSFNGIGDLLFVTPTLRWIKEWGEPSHIKVMTNRPELLLGSPYVDEVTSERPRQTHRTDEEGVFLGYPDPINQKNPTMHHILTDWQIVCRHYDLSMQEILPTTRPEIYCTEPLPDDERNGRIGVQVLHKGHWHKKKIWPHFDELAQVSARFEAIPKVGSVLDLVELIANYEFVVCSEGGISHIAAAMNTTALVIMGGFHRPEWAGYSDHHHLVDREIWCRDECYNPGPCKSEVVERECMRKWDVEHVLELIGTG